MGTVEIHIQAFGRAEWTEMRFSQDNNSQAEVLQREELHRAKYGTQQVTVIHLFLKFKIDIFTV